ncbi:protein phosphatase 2C domain-containing protein [Bacillus pinisoli]|uniref:protein phosphatase 2C domain-containing protein n=1 Tax=Bacillus pinisoli TaxID=2901866 RepID=UPI001FF18DD0|nr:protein phosphatase 2C domain-containing protein [Bacillus pinisoli]
MVYLFHPELAALGQYQVNQRHFYEWIGQVNTFEREIPCYSLGIKELRRGKNRLFLTTDGLIECPNTPYAHPKDIYQTFNHSNDDESIHALLHKIQDNQVKDSTTIVSWTVHVSEEATKASNQ